MSPSADATLTAAAAASFAAMWADVEPVGQHSRTGGYRRFAWSEEDGALREWFTGEAQRRGLSLAPDRAGNLWAWWGDPDADGPGIAAGSHLDSVPDGGAFDGPLGVVSAFAAVDELRGRGIRPGRPLGVALFADEEGARFGVACAGSKLLTGALAPEQALDRSDAGGTTIGEAMARAGVDTAAVGRDDEALRRVDTFVELHVEQGRALADLDRSVAVASAIRAHGRWRLDLLGEANHAGTTRLADRNDPMLALAAVITAARREAEQRGCVATVGKVIVEPNGVNAIPSRVRAWLDARSDDEQTVHALAAAVAEAGGVAPHEESFLSATVFDEALQSRLSALLDGAPVLPTGAGHDAGVLATAGVRSAMLFVRNPTGVSHSPAEHAEAADCLAGVAALATVLEDLVH